MKLRSEIKEHNPGTKTKQGKQTLVTRTKKKIHTYNVAIENGQPALLILLV